MYKNIDVVYFDYWTRGVRHFASIDPYIRNAGYNTLLVHMGSLRGEPVVYNHQLSGIKCMDLFFFQNNPVKMLLELRPKLVLLLNNQTEDRIIVRACRNLNIKTVFLMHGVLSTDQYIENSVNLIDSAFGLIERLRRVPKYLRLLSCYFHAAKLRSIWSFFQSDILLYFIRQCISPGGNLLGKYNYVDGVADLALVYSEDDKKYFVSFFGYKCHSVHVCGNYNLDSLFVRFSTVRSKPLCEKYVTYIENGFSDPKFTIPGWTEELVAREVQEFARVCTRFGYKLVLKLHPSSNYSSLLSILKAETNIDIIANCDLSELILNSKIVIGQSSSVLMMAAVLQKPVIIPNIAPLKLMSRIYADKGVGKIVNDISEFTLEFNHAINRESPNNLMSFALKEFVGPFDGLSTCRIAKIITSNLQDD